MHCEFSLEHYQDILELAGSRIGTMAERKDIVLTHDIDIMPSYALTMAELEHERSIRSTYYVLLHSEWYNALSPENVAIFKQIQELGHELALHYDVRYDGDLETVHKAFCAMLNTECTSVAQHLIGQTPRIPVPAHLQDRAAIEDHQYIADSGGWWRNGCLCSHLNKRLLVVCHPVWWIKSGFESIEHDAVEGFKRTTKFWTEMVNEHRKQQAVQVTARST